MKPAALLFDVDGTLADTEEAHRQAFNGAFSRLGYTWSWDREQYRELLQVSGGKERIAHFVRSLGLDARREDQCLADVGAIHQTKTELYKHSVATGAVALRPGVARLLGEARSAGVRLGIATTTSPANVTGLLTAALGTGAPGWFETIVAGDMVAAKKPAPDVYLAALRDLALAPRDCIAFEDSDNGLRSALAAGLNTVVTPTWWTREQDFSRAWLTLPELGDPERPLAPAAARRLRQPWLTVEDLADATTSAA